MDEDEVGYDDVSSSSEESDQIDDLDTDYGAPDGLDTDEGAEDAEEDASPEGDADDLPAFTDTGYTEEEREAYLEALGDDPLSAIEAIVERRVAARLASATHANMHLARQAGTSPELYRMYGPTAQAMLSQMAPATAASKQGVQMATLGAIAQDVMKTGDLEAVILKAARAIEKGRGGANTSPARRPTPLPPEARTPSPSVGKRPSAGSRGNGRGSVERATNALAEMTGASSTAARRYFEEN